MIIKELTGLYACVFNFDHLLLDSSLVIIYYICCLSKQLFHFLSLLLCERELLGWAALPILIDKVQRALTQSQIFLFRFDLLLGLSPLLL